jgi:hypothetical protein
MSFVYVVIFSSSFENKIYIAAEMFLVFHGVGRVISHLSS